MILHEYETIFVTRPELADDEHTRLKDKFLGIVTSREGSILELDDWGRRKLAYEIKKHAYGHYYYLNYIGPADLPSELERNMRIEDNLIRWLTVRLGTDVDLEERRVVAEERKRLKAERAAEMAANAMDDEESDEPSDDA